MNDFAPRNQPAEVYVVFGAEPEINAYAMAKYSRSALSMRESLREINGQKAEKFLNTFYFQYGHRSIADLAHLSMALENISMVAAIDVADETRWDGQERSTRYQEFRQSGFVVPPELTENERASFLELIQSLYTEYEWFSSRVQSHLSDLHPKPEAMKAEIYQRTLRARAFDVSRYLLPMATCTSLGQIVSARTLEQQIVRLLSSQYGECRALGAALKQAASAPGAVPTLVKYTDPNPYQVRSRGELAQAASELLHDVAPDSTPGVALAEPMALEIEVAASLLYSACHHSYAQIVSAVAALPVSRRDEIVTLGQRHRGSHDELLRAYQSGQAIQFDILTDIGGFRDLHRHRRCVQLHQDYTGAHGFDTPTAVNECGAGDRYQAAMEAAGRWADGPGRLAQASSYGLALGYRRRSLFKMDFAEAAYITELRTAPAGHFSYRATAWQMYEAVRRRHPVMAEKLRVTNPSVVDNPLER